MNFFNEILDNKYRYLIEDIVENSAFLKLDSIKHHGTSRLYHSLKVSYYSYKITKFLRLDYEATARAGLLHDFYFERTKYQNKIKDKIKLFTIKHPKDAISNSKEYFCLSDKEIDIIASHMFPIDIKIPKYAESWIVSLIDKVISIKEFSTKINYQIYVYLNVWMFFLINIRK